MNDKSNDAKRQVARILESIGVVNPGVWEQGVINQQWRTYASSNGHTLVGAEAEVSGYWRVSLMSRPVEAQEDMALRRLGVIAQGWAGQEDLTPREENFAGAMAVSPGGISPEYRRDTAMGVNPHYEAPEESDEEDFEAWEKEASTGKNDALNLFGDEEEDALDFTAIVLRVAQKAGITVRNLEAEDRNGLHIGLSLQLANPPLTAEEILQKEA